MFAGALSQSDQQTQPRAGGYIVRKEPGSRALSSAFAAEGVNSQSEGYARLYGWLCAHGREAHPDKMVGPSRGCLRTMLVANGVIYLLRWRSIRVTYGVPSLVINSKVIGLGRLTSVLSF